MESHILYKVAEHLFAIYADNRMLNGLTQYEPFLISEKGNEEVVCSLFVVSAEDFPETDGYQTEVIQKNEELKIISGRLPDGRGYMESYFMGKEYARMVMSEDYREGYVMLGENRLFGLNNSIQPLFAFASANSQTMMFHAATVSYQGRCYLFLGKSGTGKSTHARLWLEHIEGAELVNDDNPIVRYINGAFRVFGSPWSGKTPCYRQVNYPLGGVVKIKQAPYNAIKKLGPLEAYGEIMTSVVDLRWMKNLADAIHQSESQLVEQIPVWRLECLPNKEAALLCCNTITQE